MFGWRKIIAIMLMSRREALVIDKLVKHHIQFVGDFENMPIKPEHYRLAMMRLHGVCHAPIPEPSDYGLR